MKIAILSDSFPPHSEGGAAVIAYHHASELRKRGHEVLVITVSKETEQRTIKEEGIIVETIHSEYNHNFRSYTSLNNKKVVAKVDVLLAAFKPDVIHVHNIHVHLSYASLKIAKKHTKALFLTIHDSMSFHYSKLFPETIGAIDGNVKSYKVSALKQLMLFKKAYNPFRNFIIKKYLKYPTKIFAVSAALKQALNDNGIGNVEVLHNGIDVTRWGTSPNTQNDIIYVFFGGRLSAVKGGDVLVKSIIEISKTYPVKLLVVGGENNYSRKLEETSPKSIVSMGYKLHSEMKNVYAKSSIVAVPSLCFDWFPTVILEAMASKKPVIATCFGGAKEMVEEGKTGFIINPYRKDELKNALIKLVSNTSKADQMGRAGYERVKAHFSIDAHMKKLLAWYDKALS